ncbi:MAG: hypothetical protein KKH72_07015 [Alphaproteobacteria bacterium]|nr:hypothetical protein [Alphaproteobacteria bacterium]
MSKTIDPRDIKWFGPLWRRIVLVAIIAVWTAVEWVNGDQFWAFMTLAVLGYAVWKLFIDFPSAADIAAFEKAETEKAAAVARPAPDVDEDADAGTDVPGGDDDADRR